MSYGPVLIVLATYLSVAHAQEPVEVGKWTRTEAALSSEQGCRAVEIVEQKLNLSRLTQTVGDGLLLVSKQTLPIDLGCAPEFTTASWQVGGELQSTTGSETWSLRAVFGTCVQGDCLGRIDLKSHSLVVQPLSKGTAEVSYVGGPQTKGKLFQSDAGLPPPSEQAGYRQLLTQHRLSLGFPVGTTAGIVHQALLFPSSAGFGGYVSISRISDSKTVLTEIFLVEGPSNDPRQVHYFLV